MDRKQAIEIVQSSFFNGARILGVREISSGAELQSESENDLISFIEQFSFNKILIVTDYSYYLSNKERQTIFDKIKEDQKNGLTNLLIENYIDEDFDNLSNRDVVLLNGLIGSNKK